MIGWGTGSTGSTDTTPRPTTPRPHHTPRTDQLAAEIRDTRRRAAAYAAGECTDAAPRVRAIADGMARAWELVTGATTADPAWSGELDAAAMRHDLARWQNLTRG